MVDQLTVRYHRTDSAVKPPERAHHDDAGLDLRSTVPVSLNTLERQMVPTGLRLAIPPEYCGLILPRSGLAWKKGIGIVNAPGLIDPGYRGEVNVLLVNLSNSPVTLEPGERVAQLLIVKTENLPWVEATELSASSRGSGGFGSTGQH